MTPVLQALVAIGIGVLLCLLFLRQMSLIVRSHPPHMRKIILIILRRFFLGILLQNLNDLTAAGNVFSIHPEESFVGEYLS